MVEGRGKEAARVALTAQMRSDLGETGLHQGGRVVRQGVEGSKPQGLLGSVENGKI